MRSFFSSILNLVSTVSRKSPIVIRAREANINLISKKTAALLSNIERRDLKEARRKDVEKACAASLYAEAAYEIQGGNSRRIDEGYAYVKRVVGTAGATSATNTDEKPPDLSKHNSGKKSLKIYRRRLSDSTWTTEPMDDKLIWVDCEMTGLNPDLDMIMEIGCVITGPDLQEIARTQSIIIYVPEDKLSGMDAWCTSHHGDVILRNWANILSGLTESCRQSKATSEEIDDQLYNFIQKHTKKGECPMAGNSIYMDRLFISKQFPKFHSHFHYRNIDVSTLKELVRRWYPDEYSKAPKKRFAHRVVDDIEDSIAELQYYRSAIFREKFSCNSKTLIDKN